MNSHDFDEDLSELEEDKEQEGNDTERFKDQDNDSNEDDETGRSYDGSDADYYYELKEERIARKQEKLRELREKERQRDIEKTKEEEVRAAYESLKAQNERKTIPIGLLSGQSFNLFCSDHVDHVYSDLYTTKRVDFYNLHDMTDPRLQKQGPGGGADILYGDVCLNAKANCNFGPFLPPKRASREPFKVSSCDGKYELSFKFIGNGYLKLSVSREMVFMNPYSPSSPAPRAAAPEVFEFVGIWRDKEKERAERQERMTKARRSPSPRESWFEMNHPMGSWHE